jgi:hypothetical protein
MTTLNDFDRVLGEWLNEGPNRAPDRPVDLAVEHARSHPRRPDPIGFLRPDPMARPFRGLGTGLRPAMILATVALLLAAVVAIGVGGPKPSVVLPNPSPSASPSLSPIPSSSPHPSPTGPASAGILVDLTVAAGEPQTVDVTDESGKLLEATSGSPTGDGQSFPSDAVEVTNIDPTTLQLGWAGFPCRTDHELRIGSDPRLMTLVRPPCEGVTDSIGIDRVLILRFSEPIVAAEVEVTLQ